MMQNYLALQFQKIGLFSLFLSKLLHRTYRHTYILSSWSGLSIVGMGVDTPGQRSLPEKPNIMI